MFDIKELHIHNTGVDELMERVAGMEATLKEQIMATKEEVLTAVQAEAGEVAGKIGELQQKIDELVAVGVGASPADLDEIKAAVQAIFTPTE